MQPRNYELLDALISKCVSLDGLVAKFISGEIQRELDQPMPKRPRRVRKVVPITVPADPATFASDSREATPASVVETQPELDLEATAAAAATTALTPVSTTTALVVLDVAQLESAPRCQEATPAIAMDATHAVDLTATTVGVAAAAAAPEPALATAETVAMDVDSPVRRLQEKRTHRTMPKGCSFTFGLRGLTVRGRVSLAAVLQDGDATKTPSRRLLRGSYIRLEDMSGKYKAEFREYPGFGNVCGFPMLMFNGTL